ncbi:MAG: UDP-N-acetylmuramoyl-L-alanyl-D-glutamate--2,6-diaminopimelate ligase, partial [Patescibacteria group bacterium]|nr:UDP-N-acetylmuramoyl-L-alanyl-D-glutamate--2,6-diaminopimelate ligase [Patescibacteria group bacterium]
SQIKFGIQNSKFKIQNLYEILDRREAIKKALNLARQGDVVIITGKGCESSIYVAGGKKIPWDDRKVVREEFAKFKNQT